MLSSFKQICSQLSAEDVTKIVSDPEEYLGVLFGHLAPTSYYKCDACGDFVSLIHTKIEGYKGYLEDVCEECIRYCKWCDRQYAPSGAYRHDDCENNTEDE